MIDEEVFPFYYFIAFVAIVDGGIEFHNVSVPTTRRIAKFDDLMEIQGKIKDMTNADEVSIIFYTLLRKQRTITDNAELVQMFTELPRLERDEQLKKCLDLSPINGYILEFGVGEGESIETIAEHIGNRVVYGFDWFKGLPENWFKEDKTLKKGTYAQEEIPDVRNNVSLVVGRFQDTLEGWIDEHQEGSIGFIHMDADLYSSTKYVLETLNDLIVPGTIIVFDELFELSEEEFEYPNWQEEGEWRAMIEWMEQYDREAEPISRTDYAGAIRIIG